MDTPMESLVIVPGSNLNLVPYINAPVVLTGFTLPTTVNLPVGGALTPAPGSAQSYYMLINGGDATAKPTLTVNATRSDVLFLVAGTATPVASLTLNIGDAAIFVQDLNYEKQINALVVSKFDPSTVPIPIATSATLGGVITGTTLATTTAGVVNIATNVVMSEAEAGTGAAMTVCESAAKLAASNFDSTGVYLQIGSRENIATGSAYRLIGIGQSSPSSVVPYMLFGGNDLGETATHQAYGDAVLSLCTPAGAATPMLRLTCADGRAYLSSLDAGALTIASKLATLGEVQAVQTALQTTMTGLAAKPTVIFTTGGWAVTGESTVVIVSTATGTPGTMFPDPTTMDGARVKLANYSAVDGLLLNASGVTSSFALGNGLAITSPKVKAGMVMDLVASKNGNYWGIVGLTTLPLLANVT